MRQRFNVWLELPEDATASDGCGYIEAALRCHRGSLRPASDDDDSGDPMANLDRSSISVGYHRRD